MRIVKLQARSDMTKFGKELQDVRRIVDDTDYINSIICDVRERGDAALREYEGRFGSMQSGTPVRVSGQEIKEAYSRVSRTELAALATAGGRLRSTEEATKRMVMQPVRVEDYGGAVDSSASSSSTGHGKDGSVITVTRNFVPIESIGCYAPGGEARYPSSVIMSVIPAKVAGVPRIVVVSPTRRNGDVDPVTIVAADTCGATEIYRVGGAHAIAALAYGTESMRRVDKIVGPGGGYVTAAKLAVSADVGIDMAAGPTELGIIADESALARLVALDLISQAEHSRDTLCYLITTSAKLAEDVNEMLSKIVARGLQRADIVVDSLSKNGFIAVVDSEDGLGKLANILAPEHLQIMTKNPAETADTIRTPGLILLGSQTPSSSSHYLLGSNHILTTDRGGRMRGSLSVLDFLKMRTVVSSTNGALHNIREDMQTLSKAEGLPNHYEAVRGRLERNYN